LTGRREVEPPAWLVSPRSKRLQAVFHKDPGLSDGGRVSLIDKQ
jgi:hypothetical protein